MRICPKCGYREEPIWRNHYKRLYTQYCHIDELTTFNPTLASSLLQTPFASVDEVKYLLSKTNHVQRIDAFLCKYSDPKDPRITEPDREKHLAKLIGYPRNQTRLFEKPQHPHNEATQ